MFAYSTIWTPALSVIRRGVGEGRWAVGAGGEAGHDDSEGRAPDHGSTVLSLGMVG